MLSAGAFVFMSSRPATYVAEATNVVARVPADIDFGSGLRFRPEVNIGIDTYRTLAFSRPVLQELAERFEIPHTSLESRLDLVTVSSSASFLAVDHRVSMGDPALAAAIANVWAEMSVQRARDLLLENLDAVEAITNNGLLSVRSRVEALEGDVQRFQVDSVARLGDASVAAEEARAALAERLESERTATLVAGESRVLRARELRAAEGDARLATLDDVAALVLGAARDEALVARLAFEVAEESRMLRARELRAAEGDSRLAAFDEVAERSSAELRQQQLQERLAFRLDEDARILRDRTVFVAGVASALQGELRGVENTLLQRRALLSALEEGESAANLELVLELAPEVVLTRDGAVATLRPIVAALQERQRSLSAELIERRAEVRSLDAELAEFEAREAAVEQMQRLEMEALERSQLLQRDALVRLLERTDAEAFALDESQRASRVAAFARGLELGLEELERSQLAERDALARLIEREDAEARVAERLSLENLAAQLERAAAVELAQLNNGLSLAKAGIDAGLERQSAALLRQLDDARREYNTLIPIEPGVALAAQIAPAGARVLAEAVPPLDPESNRALLIAALAFVVSLFAGLVLVLLAEAVRDPNSKPTPTPAATASPARTPPDPAPA